MQVELRSLSKYFTAQTVFRDLDFKFIPHSRSLIVGRNSAGKSTLLKIIAGILRPSSGEVLIDGNRLRATEKLKVGFQGTDLFLYPSLTVRENFRLIGSLIARDSEGRMLHLAEKLSLAESLKKEVRVLSSGQKQKLGFIRALCAEPKVLLLDEPLSFLDEQSRVDVLNIVSESTATIFVASHEREPFVGLGFKGFEIDNGALKCL